MATSFECYPNKKKLVLFMPREQHSAQQGGDVSLAILGVRILLSVSFFPFGFYLL